MRPSTITVAATFKNRRARNRLAIENLDGKVWIEQRTTEQLFRNAVASSENIVQLLPTRMTVKELNKVNEVERSFTMHKAESCIKEETNRLASSTALTCSVAANFKKCKAITQETFLSVVVCQIQILSIQMKRAYKDKQRCSDTSARRCKNHLDRQSGGKRVTNINGSF
ncbi:hypothetical protein L596_010318 [Steinernema carpocapsae]|uniref:Uncharacterized protein n=1 Tax=Steinernema carpocapsae TaxID=34508 RepID=A0A4U5PI09_STECR|nr:hypothetical protein L596_010318 [Steinernema carpocapsae]